MATDPLAYQDILAQLENDPRPWAGLPANTTLDHMHLHVANIPQAEAFYTKVIGFDLMLRYQASAIFLSAGGYHHHLGIKPNSA
jgi:catechol 2,3-dioxygenase